MLPISKKKKNLNYQDYKTPKWLVITNKKNCPTLLQLQSRVDQSNGLSCSGCFLKKENELTNNFMRPPLVPHSTSHSTSLTHYLTHYLTQSPSLSTYLTTQFIYIYYILLLYMQVYIFIIIIIIYRNEGHEPFEPLVLAKILIFYNYYNYKNIYCRTKMVPHSLIPSFPESSK